MILAAFSSLINFVEIDLLLFFFSSEATETWIHFTENVSKYFFSA